MLEKGQRNQLRDLCLTYFPLSCHTHLTYTVVCYFNHLPNFQKIYLIWLSSKFVAIVRNRPNIERLNICITYQNFRMQSITNRIHSFLC